MTTSTTPVPPAAPQTIPTAPPLQQPTLDVAALQNVLQQLANAIQVERAHAEMLFTQSETLTALLAWLRPDAPFPATRGWAASPDFLMLEAQAIREIAQHDGLEHLHIVEASSGVSTLTAAYTLKRLGADPATAQVTSYEHDGEYAAKTQAMIDEHGLAEFATVVHAPLVRHEIDGMAFQWYDPATIADLAPISVLVVDGPPGRLGPIARFPAVPVFASKFKPGAIVLADDAGRPGETEMVKRWSAAWPDASCESIATEKGAARMRWPR